MSAFLRGMAYAVALALGIVSIVIHFSNPDMTETRLFLNYWPLWVGGAGVIALLLLASEAYSGDA